RIHVRHLKWFPAGGDGPDRDCSGRILVPASGAWRRGFRRRGQADHRNRFANRNRFATDAIDRALGHLGDRWPRRPPTRDAGGTLRRAPPPDPSLLFPRRGTTTA